MLVRSVFNGVDSVKSAQFVSVTGTSLIIQKISVFTIDSTILSFSASKQHIFCFSGVTDN